ncbi:MAG: hypothetical protein ACQEQ0_09000 [Bacteroidota bacterium]
MSIALCFGRGVPTTTASPPAHEYSTMLRHGDSFQRASPTILMRPEPITRKWKSRLEAG